MAKKILIVDDEIEIRELLNYNLTREGYEISEASNGKEALKTLENKEFDLILLDVMMPGMDGIEVCSQIRNLPQHKNAIICFLTARNEDYSQIAGFDAGADDYISKPIKPRVLLSRINALLRRSNIETLSSSQTLGNLTIDREKYSVSLNDEHIHLPRKEFELLSLLASKPGKVFEREYILRNIWGDEVVVGDRTIDVHIRKLREKVGDQLIKTVKGIGYSLEI